jgi:hypothetical protein
MATTVRWRLWIRPSAARFSIAGVFYMRREE